MSSMKLRRPSDISSMHAQTGVSIENRHPYRNEIVVWANGNVTMIGGDAYRLYYALFEVYGEVDIKATHTRRDMRYLLEYIPETENAIPLIHQAIEVERALSGKSLAIRLDGISCPISLRKATPEEEGY